MTAGWTNFRAVRHKDGTSNISPDAGSNIQNGHAFPANQHLKVKHQPHLNENCESHMDHASVQKQRKKHAVELIRIVSSHKRKHATDIREAVHLTAQSCVLMKVTFHECAVLPSRYTTLALHLDAARSSSYLAGHMYRQEGALARLLADRPS